MISEIILVLGGHESSLFLKDSQLDPAFLSDLHPGERECLEFLATVGRLYRTIRLECRILLSSSSSPYICAACATLVHILREYEAVVVTTEAQILNRDVELVSTGALVPFASLRAKFAEWRAPLTSLTDLVEDLKVQNTYQNEGPYCRPAPLLDLLMARSATGVERIADMMIRISVSVQRVWKSQLISYLHCHAPSRTSFASNTFALREGTIPACISEISRDSIEYVGRAVGAVKTAKSKHQPPRTMMLDHTILLENILPDDQHTFDTAIAEIRSQVSNYLWLTVLTRKDVMDAVDSLASYFLLMNGEFSLSFIREIERLKLSRLMDTERTSSVIREQDIARALLRASLGTTAQHDPALSKLKVSLPSGPHRPLLPRYPSMSMSTSLSLNMPKAADPFLFTSQLLGTPLLLSYTTTFPLDLFLDKVALDTYAALFGYLSGIRRIHTRIHGCWASLSNAQRQRRVWTGLSDGGTDEDSEARKQLLRCGWGLVRDMSWFMDTLLGYNMIDVVATEFNQFKDTLQQGLGIADLSDRGASLPTSVSRAPTASQASALDFTTLRGLHSEYLERLLSGCLLTNAPLMVTLKGIFDVCEQFSGQIERWGDILPALLSEGTLQDDTQKVGALVKERWRIVEEMNNVLHTHFDEFCDHLSASTSGQPFGSIDASRSMAFNSHYANKSEATFPSKGGTEARRHIERLLLRLDFNTSHPLHRSRTSVQALPP